MAFLLAWVLLAWAAPTEAALDRGRPACDYCRMILTDPRFGAELTLRSGATRIYDALECMAAAVLTDSVAIADVRQVRLADHARPGQRLDLREAVFLHCPSIESPMGQSLLTVGRGVPADTTCRAGNGERLDWRGVLVRVDSTWFQGRLPVEPHARFPALRRSDARRR